MASQVKNGNPANYNTSPDSRTNGDASAFEVDQKGNQLVNLNVALALLLSGVETDTIGVAPFRRADAFQSVPTDTTANTAQSVEAAVSQKTIYITDLIISTDGGAACSVIVQDDSGTPVKIEKVWLGTTPQTIAIHYATPKACTLGQALKYICSSAAPHISVSAAGYII